MKRNGINPMNIIPAKPSRGQARDSIRPESNESRMRFFLFILSKIANNEFRVPGTEFRVMNIYEFTILESRFKTQILIKI